jgi:hypothetical protein
MRKSVTRTVLNTKKTVHQNAHGSETLYSGSVTAVTPKTIVVFMSALDVEVDVQPSQYIHPERLRPHRRFWQLGY